MKRPPSDAGSAATYRSSRSYLIPVPVNAFTFCPYGMIIAKYRIVTRHVLRLRDMRFPIVCRCYYSPAADFCGFCEYLFMAPEYMRQCKPSTLLLRNSLRHQLYPHRAPAEGFPGGAGNDQGPAVASRALIESFRPQAQRPRVRCLTPYGVSVRWKTTRRFAARPSAVLLSPSGWLSP